jgi:hypothetical protein
MPGGEDADVKSHGHSHHLRGFLGRWFLVNSLLSGTLALLWLVFRSGPKPSRLAYPCQRAAVSAATLAFGAPLVAAAIAVRRRIRPVALVAAAAAGLALTVSLTIHLPQAAVSRGPMLHAPLSYRAQVFHVTGCPQDPAGDHFVGLSNLLGVMGRGGLKFYRSAAVSPVAGPGGIVAANDVVIIKINYQWDQRGGTNTDLLRGLIHAIVHHPDGFTGEVIVCENAQYSPVYGFDRPLNNAQDNGQSPHDVVLGFQGQGYSVSHYDWTAVRGVPVNEYSTGDANDGYVVGAYDDRWQGKLSYPKFRSATGTCVSLRYGIWNAGSGSYDRARLKFINVPVLKSHHSTYGATASVKHYMGVVTGQLSTNSHTSIALGIMGALMDEIQLADLNIVDAIWINANPNTGPSTPYAGATRRDELVASLDPIALDLWSVKNILVPGFVSNGYAPPWPTPSADPDLPAGAFRTYVDNSMNQLLAAGHQVTNDFNQIDVRNGNGGAGDFDHDGAVNAADYDRLAACYTGPGGGPVGPECAAADFDGDGDVDCDDARMFNLVWTATSPPPTLPACSPIGVPDDGAPGPGTRLARAVPNPMARMTAIAYSIATPGPVRLAVFDVSGRLVRTLVDRDEGAGNYSVRWDGRSDRGDVVGRGVYACRLQAPGFVGSQKVVIP